MKFNDFYLEEYHDRGSDKFMQLDVSDTRRPRLTLRHIQKLRKRRAMEKYEKELRQSRLSSIYAAGE